MWNVLIVWSIASIGDYSPLFGHGGPRDLGRAFDMLSPLARPLWMIERRTSVRVSARVMRNFAGDVAD